MATMVRSMALEGIEGFPVEIEAAVIRGQQQMISIIGLGDQAVKESGERMQAAMACYGYDLPKDKALISLAPGNRRKHDFGAFGGNGSDSGKRDRPVRIHRRIVAGRQDPIMPRRAVHDHCGAPAWDQKSGGTTLGSDPFKDPFKRILMKYCGNISPGHY